MKNVVSRVPSVVVELLRFLIVLFGAGLGYQVARSAGVDPNQALLGPFNVLWVGVIVGAGLGYSLGGVLVRWLVVAFDRGERVLDGMSAEQVVAGSFGALVAGALATLVAWPLFLVVSPVLAIPLFLFIVVGAGLFGFRSGRRRRGAVIEVMGPRAGMSGSQRRAAVRLPRVLDTSVAIDGRILDVVRAGFQAGVMLVPEPVLGELQALADSADDRRRARGRRGLDVLEALRREQTVDLEVIPDSVPEVDEVDAKLVRICQQRPAALLTFDTNLAKVASLAGVRVLNMHSLALALRPPVAVGDDVAVHLVKPGKEAGQAVAYLDDGTMVVVESARDHVGQDVHVVISSVLTTANGRLVFGRLVGGRDTGRRPRAHPAPPPDQHPTPADLRPGPVSRSGQPS